MGVGRIFCKWGHKRIFPKFFPGGAKSGEICFFPLKTKKITIFAKNSHSRVGVRPFLPPFRRPWLECQHWLRFAKEIPNVVINATNIPVKYILAVRQSLKIRSWYRWYVLNNLRVCDMSIFLIYSIWMAICQHSAEKKQEEVVFESSFSTRDKI